MDGDTPLDFRWKSSRMAGWKLMRRWMDGYGGWSLDESKGGVSDAKASETLVGVLWSWGEGGPAKRSQVKK